MSIGNFSVFDVETTTKNKGDPFTPENKLCTVVFDTDCFNIEYDDTPYGQELSDIQEIIDGTDWLVAFNAKFDLHWLRRYGITFEDKKIWDCQLAHFLLTRQETRYPSLNQVAEYYELPTKLDVVSTEYWEKGIDTPDVPYEILQEYNLYDVELTKQIFLKQQEDFKDKPQLHRLFYLQSIDLLILEEMEWNGMRYDKEKSSALAQEVQAELSAIVAELNSFFPGIPINWNSNDHVSMVLYGGLLKDVRRECVGTYKTGAKFGQPRYKLIPEEYELPQLVKPLRGTELAKEGMYSTDKKTLERLRGNKKAKHLIQLMLKQAELSKLLNTYYIGYSDKVVNDYLHGRFNQCVTATGRLSSSDPNLQNVDSRVDQCFISRYNYDLS